MLLQNKLARLLQIDMMVVDELLVSVSLVEHTYFLNSLAKLLHYYILVVVELVWVLKSQNNLARYLQIGMLVLGGLALVAVVVVLLVVEHKNSQNN